MEYPYFRFSKYVSSVEVLESWARHFESLGIPCAIVEDFDPQPRSYNGKKTFSLWRIGAEHHTPDLQYKSNEEKLRGVIVRTYLEFDMLIG